ncbi:hypothetical protein SAMD00019534_025170, partial [Acytostelium subglobosum LB1]|uniref:hypothetical protein n=1 Tax=Acytostelium subglobosum LB1 TaxID=1410327 RepID=UPI000644FCD8
MASNYDQQVIKSVFKDRWLLRSILSNVSIINHNRLVNRLIKRVSKDCNYLLNMVDKFMMKTTPSSSSLSSTTSSLYKSKYNDWIGKGREMLIHGHYGLLLDHVKCGHNIGVDGSGGIEGFFIEMLCKSNKVNKVTFDAVYQSYTNWFFTSNLLNLAVDGNNQHAISTLLRFGSRYCSLEIPRVLEAITRKKFAVFHCWDDLNSHQQSKLMKKLGLIARSIYTSRPSCIRSLLFTHDHGIPTKITQPIQGMAHKFKLDIIISGDCQLIYDLLSLGSSQGQNDTADLLTLNLQHIDRLIENDFKMLDLEVVDVDPLIMDDESRLRYIKVFEHKGPRMRFSKLKTIIRMYIDTGDYMIIPFIIDRSLKDRAIANNLFGIIILHGTLSQLNIAFGYLCRLIKDDVENDSLSLTYHSIDINSSLKRCIFQSNSNNYNNPQRQIDVIKCINNHLNSTDNHYIYNTDRNYTILYTGSYKLLDFILSLPNKYDNDCHSGTISLEKYTQFVVLNIDNLSLLLSADQVAPGNGRMRRQLTLYNTYISMCYMAIRCGNEQLLDQLLKINYPSDPDTINLFRFGSRCPFNQTIMLRLRQLVLGIKNIEQVRRHSKWWI